MSQILASRAATGPEAPPQQLAVDTDEIYMRERLLAARDLEARWGGQLRRTEPIASLLARLERAVTRSWRLMAELDLVTTCKECDRKAGGSCCARAFGRKFDPYLLLINLMLGVEPPQHHLRPDSCYFLGERGCTLKARLFICVDYLCPGIMARLSPGELHQLQAAYGDELHTEFLLYDAVKTMIRKHGQGLEQTPAFRLHGR